MSKAMVNNPHAYKMARKSLIPNCGDHLPPPPGLPQSIVENPKSKEQHVVPPPPAVEPLLSNYVTQRLQSEPLLPIILSSPRVQVTRPSLVVARVPIEKIFSSNDMPLLEDVGSNWGDVLDRMKELHMVRNLSFVSLSKCAANVQQKTTNIDALDNFLAEFAEKRKSTARVPYVLKSSRDHTKGQVGVVPSSSRFLPAP